MGVEVIDMAKRFKTHDPDQLLLLPPSLADWLPKNHLVYFVRDVVNALDLSAFYRAYKGTKGQPPYPPVMMVAVWVYGYMLGIRSSRRIERALHEDVGFRVLAGNRQPDFWTLNQFRTRHRKAFAALLQQSILMADKAGLVKLRQVAVDGTKIQANASKHSAMSYGRMNDEEARLRDNIERYLDECDETDKQEDDEFGPRRGDELPEHLADDQKRIEAIQKAKNALEEEARERARAAQDERRNKAQEEGRDFHPRSDPEQAVPEPKSQRNFTDPESRIMVTGKSFVQGYNAQAAVDAETQIIVAADLSNLAADAPHLIPMIEQVEANTGQTPREVSADAGYWSESNLAALDDKLIDAFIPPDRLKHGDARRQKPPVGRIPNSASRADRMRRRLQTQHGRTRYKMRRCSVEPVFGQTKAARGLRQFLHRGRDKVCDFWRFEGAAHNLLKIFRAGLREAAKVGQQVGGIVAMIAAGPAPPQACSQ